MYNDFISAYLDDNLCAGSEVSDVDNRVNKKIQKAESLDEIADILSDELVKSLISQIHL